jgi:antitoxin component of RelBE/YafQ-DinJ toxin-antitoxin module
MNTQVIFKIDKTLKEKAMKKARMEGIPFSSVLTLATRSFVEGSLDVQMVQRPVLNDKTRKMLDRAMKDIKAGKNLSPRFKSAKEMIAHLNAR